MTDLAAEVSRTAPQPVPGSHSAGSFWALTLGSVGVVYGDIGTSPLYAFREALVPARTDGILLPEEVIGTVSLILWALFMIVTVKYVAILLRMDNNGEGGILSLMALARKALAMSSAWSEPHPTHVRAVATICAAFSPASSYCLAGAS